MEWQYYKDMADARIKYNKALKAEQAIIDKIEIPKGYSIIRNSTIKYKDKQLKKLQRIPWFIRVLFNAL